MKHLNEKTANLVLTLSENERINAVKKAKWIGYAQAKKVLSRIEDLMTYPTYHRMPNLLLVGDTNNGKTALLNRFYSLHEPYLKEEDSELVMPILIVQAPPEPDEKRFYNAILEKTGAPYRTTEKVEVRQQRVIYLLKKIKVKVLIIDEIHHVLAGTLSKQRLFLNVIKYLSNELQISMVCSGIRDAYNAIQTDTQLANRFEPIVLPRWSYDEEYLRLLASFESIIPLKEPSYLTEGEIAKKILLKSEGLIGEISTIIQRSAVLAIESGVEKITKSIIDSIEYDAPSERKKRNILKI